MLVDMGSYYFLAHDNAWGVGRRVILGPRHWDCELNSIVDHVQSM